MAHHTHNDLVSKINKFYGISRLYHRLFWGKKKKSKSVFTYMDTSTHTDTQNTLS